MNVDIERGFKLLTNAQKESLKEDSGNEQLSERERFSKLLDMMGMIGGYDPNTFEEEKEAILNSDISLADFETILNENLADKLGPREIVNVDIQLLTSSAKEPTYAHETDACADIYADETVTIEPGETTLVSTGFAIAVPLGYVAHIYPRSSIGAKTMLRLSNSVGVIDAGYRDEVKVIYTNTGDTPYTINKGNRIAQMCIDASPIARFHRVSDVKAIGEDREGGIGSTGGLAENTRTSQEA